MLKGSNSLKLNNNTTNSVFLYHYSELIDAVNTAIESLYMKAQAAYPDISPLLTTPKFYLNYGICLQFSCILNSDLDGSASYFGINDKLNHYLGTRISCFILLYYLLVWI